MIIEYSDVNRYLGVLKSPGIPWNLDVSLMVLVYLAIGFYYKKQIKRLLFEENKNFDFIAVFFLIVVTLFCFMNYKIGRVYYFDMKVVAYRDFLGSIVIPCLFGVIIIRFIHKLENFKVTNCILTPISYVGRMTIPIMFLHMPLNYPMKYLRYGQLAYMLIGIGLPITFTLIFNRFSIMRQLFGLPKIDG